jgi:hypothetical protein
VLEHPLLGTGAGTFGHYWVRYGNPIRFGGALDAHSLCRDARGLGPLGLLLSPPSCSLAHRVIRRRGARPRCGRVRAFLVHAGLDWDWEVPAVVVTALCCAAASPRLTSSRAARSAPRRGMRC